MFSTRHDSSSSISYRKRIGAAASFLSLFVLVCCSDAVDPGGSAGGGSSSSGAAPPIGQAGSTPTAGTGGTSSSAGSSATTGGVAGTGLGTGGTVSVAGSSNAAAGAAGTSTSGGSAGNSAGSSAGGAAGSGAGGGGAGTGGTGPQPVPNEVWVAPDGSDTNPGTQAAPMKTICDTATKTGACYRLCPSSYSCPATGATIWLKGGTYKITNKIDIGATRPGKMGGIMKLYAAAGEKPVIDASGLSTADITKTGIALHLKASYWHVKGIEIVKAPHNCVKIEGGYNTVEAMVVHGCGNTGITITRYGGEDMSAGPGSNNTVLNCDSYDNVGPNNSGEDADGFGAKESSGAGNVFRGCRAWNNADDGFDFYGWTNPITVEDSWAFESGKMGASGGDGNGFKLGKGPGDHVLKNAIAAYNTKRGFTSNGADEQSTCTNCRGCNNSEGLNDTGDRAVLGSVSTLSPCPELSKAKGARGADGKLPTL